MAEVLTPQQKMAVENRGGNLLVSAAAGSGKTKVLVDRLLSYILDPVDPANIDDFLLITYTKAAAAELRGKIAKQLTKRLSEDPENAHLQNQIQRLYLTQISTVHAFCGEILREYAYRLDISGDFRIADTNECNELRQRVMDQVLDEAYASETPNPDFLAFVDTQGLGRSDKLVEEILQKVYDSARCHLNPQAWLDQCLADSTPESKTDASQTLWGKFLMEDLFAFLDLQIDAFKQCVSWAEADAQMQKPAALLKDNLFLLQQLRSFQTWDEIVVHRSPAFGKLLFPRKLDDVETAERIKAIRKACMKDLKEKLESFTDSSELVLADLGQTAPAVRGMLKLVNTFSQAYDRIKRSHRVADYSDLEYLSLDLLYGKSRNAPTVAAREIGSRFREIMVDEYQDSNEVQDALFRALTQEKHNLFMVGDVKQSIYQFRLADPGIFLEKYGKYLPATEAKPGQGRKVMLSANFRSSAGVISGVNDVFYDCMSETVGGLAYGEEEALKEGIPHVSLGEPEVELHMLPILQDTYREEAEYVAEQIEKLLDGSHMVRQDNVLRPIRPEDIVILLRSPGSVGEHYRYALERRGIACTTGSGVDLLQTPECATLRSLLQTISNPRQDIPLISVLASPIFGYTADDLASLRANCKYGSFFEALLTSQEARDIRTGEIINDLRGYARMSTLAGLLEKIFISTGLDAVYGAMADGQLRQANLQSFFRLAVEFEGTGGKGLELFLNHLEASEADGLVIPGEQSAAGAVTIMSIHKSKGLEFPVVFLCALSKRFNKENLRARVMCHKDMGLGLSCIDTVNRVRYPTISRRAIAVKTEREDLSEELRVLYVAMTRARDRLIMTYAHRNPAGELQNLVARMDGSKPALLTSGVGSMGQWVLYSALHRMEAGALFAEAGRPNQLRVSDHPWHICIAPPMELEDTMPDILVADMPRAQVDFTDLERGLSFQYPHAQAVQLPSKLTATQQKGRFKDEEAAQDAPLQQVPQRVWRKPSFVESTKDGRTYGNALHKAMQHISFTACDSESSVTEELSRLQREGYLTQEQVSMVSSKKIAAFFQTEVGQKLRNAQDVLREFKFSILVDAPEAPGEQVLLQGVVDCAIIEADGITIVDFKSDAVTQETLQQKLTHYRPQVQAYAAAMEKIYKLPIKEKYLYFFHLTEAIQV